MKPSPSDRVEIIRLVEESHLPARRTLELLGIARSSFYRWYDRYQRGGPEALADRPSRPDRVWNRIPDVVREQIIDMARDAGARKVYFASAAPPVRYPNVYGIDMPAAGELVAAGRTVDQVQRKIGADWLVYQDLEDLVQAVQHEKADIDGFDTSCFSGEYVTGDVSRAYPASRAGSENGCTRANPGSPMAIICVVALSFIVQLPSGIIVRSRARS